MRLANCSEWPVICPYRVVVMIYIKENRYSIKTTRKKIYVEN